MILPKTVDVHLLPTNKQIPLQIPTNSITLQDPPKTVDPKGGKISPGHQAASEGMRLSLACVGVGPWLRWVPEPTARTIICWRLLASEFENSKNPRQEIPNTKVGELQHVPADEMMVWLNPQSLTATSRKRDFSAKGVKGIT